MLSGCGRIQRGIDLGQQFREHVGQHADRLDLGIGRVQRSKELSFEACRIAHIFEGQQPVECHKISSNAVIHPACGLNLEGA